MAEVEAKIADAKAELFKMIADELAKQPRALTALDVRRMIDDTFLDPVRLDSHGKLISDERKRWGAEIDKLRSEHDLRISALLGEVDKLQRQNSGDSAAVIDLPRSRHA